MASAIVPEELRDGNYDSWSGCMKNYLLAHDLWDIIEGPNSSTEPPPHDEAEYKVWRKKNATALHAIQISCRPYIFRRIESTDSAKTVWDNLANSLRKRLPVSQGKNAGDIPTSDTDTDSDSDFSDTDSVSADKKREPFASSQSTGAGNFRTDSASSDKKQEPLTSSQRNGAVFVSSGKKQEPLASSQSNGADPVSSNIKQEPLASLQHNGPGVVKDENFQFAGLANSVYRGDWHSTRSFLVRHPGVVNAKITSFGHTALHIATLAGNVEIGRKLVELMSKEALAIQDGSGYTALHHAASRGIAKMARYMVEKDETLVAITSKCQWIPIVAACANNHRDTTVYLFSVTPFELLSQYQNGIHGSLLLQHAITSKMLDIALEILYRCPSLATAASTVYHRTALWALLAASPELFPSGCHLGFWQRLIYSCTPVRPLIDGKGVRAYIFDQNKIILKQVLGKWCKLCINFLKFSEIMKIYDLKMIHASSTRLLQCMCEHLSTLDERTLSRIGLPGAFIKAVELGFVEFVSATIEISPSCLYASDLKGRSMVMSSIVHRQDKVFNLLYGLARHSYVLDKSGNTMLHLAGKLSPSTQLSRISNAALQMQRELQWYKEVESIITPAAKFARNHSGETPGQVFSKNHKQLVTEGEEWMKGTAISYAVVGAFIITIMFAAAFTVPGGNIQDTGINHVVLHKKAFMTFIISDAISLFASSTSVLMFLEILTARYPEQDFLITLPRKLMIGLSTFFISVAAMMVAFSAALVVMLNGMMEVIVPIVLLACLPVTLFMFWQFPLLAEIFMSTYGPGIFKRKSNAVWRIAAAVS